MARIGRSTSGNAADSQPDQLESFGAVVRVLGPALVKGVALRREHAVGAIAALGADAGAVEACDRLRARHGPGPLRLRLPGRPHVLILSGEDARAVLEGAPEPFAPATREKRGALSQFEPRASLISTGAERARRRAANDAALRPDLPAPPGSARAFTAVETHGEAFADAGGDVIRWRPFRAAWSRATRDALLGARAAEDDALTSQLDRLRGASNWAFLAPKRRRLRDAFHRRLAAHLAAAPPDALAAGLPERSAAAATAPVDQLAHWLFASDAIGIAAFRALALLCAEPERMARARSEATAEGPDRHHLIAAFLESLRLWPTTPVILRRATRAVELPNGPVPKGAEVIVFAPFLHRDPRRADADRFAPELWSGGEGPWPLAPFSAGPAICPARRLAPRLGAAFLAGLLRHYVIAPTEESALREPLPGSLDFSALAFRRMPANGETRGAEPREPSRVSLS